MKYGELLISIINPKYKYIDYNILKKEINNNFLILLNDTIISFDEYYKKIKNKENSKDIYELILINYLTINKLLKKFRKNNPDSNLFREPEDIKNYLSKREFYKDIINLPDFCKKEDKDIQCPICLNKSIFPIRLNCNHVFCWSCLLQASDKHDKCPCCRVKTELDPTLNILRSIFKNVDKKYSPFNLKNSETLKFKIVSDLHIDHWDSDYISSHPHGEVKNIPLNLEEKGGILIVAGDVSDDINMSIDFLDRISENFEKILFVDGNHEHCTQYPYLYDFNTINQKVKEKNNKK